VKGRGVPYLYPMIVGSVFFISAEEWNLIYDSS